MEGYSHIFNDSITNFNNLPFDKHEELFSSFRLQRHIYGFIDNCDISPDVEADILAQTINLELYNKYKLVLKKRKVIGYGNLTPENGEYNQLDSRHIMMFCILFTNLPENIKNVVEIGAGYGNWLVLNKDIQQFEKWTCIDLPHLLQLQKWCYEKLDVDETKYKLISAYNYELEINNSEIDLVIGSHSLSEFSYDIFIRYFKTVIMKSKYFFYAYHNTLPNIELNTLKLTIISEQFNIIYKVISEQGNVTNCVYVNKFI